MSGTDVRRVAPGVRLGGVSFPWRPWPLLVTLLLAAAAFLVFCLSIGAGDFPNPGLVQGSMKAIAEGGYLRDGDTPVGSIDPVRFSAMAKFLFDSSVLRDVGGNALDWPGDVSTWFDQGWRGQGS